MSNLPDKDEAAAFGQMIREHRKALGMRQEDLAFSSGVGRRYIVELEAGKPTAQLGPALLIARMLGIRLVPAEAPGKDDLNLPDPEF